MGLTTLQLRLFQTHNRNTRQPRALGTLILGLAILTFAMLTGCGSSADPGYVSITPSSDGGGSNGSGSGGGSQTAVAGTASASLAWNPVSGSSVVGYIVHYGTHSPNSFGSCAYQTEHIFIIAFDYGDRACCKYDLLFCRQRV